MFFFTGPVWPEARSSPSVLASGHDGERDLHALTEVRRARVHGRVPGHPEVAPVDCRLRPEGGSDLTTERVLGLAEIARVQDDRLRYAVYGEVARHPPVRRVESLDAGAPERDRRMVLPAEQVWIHQPAHEAIVGHVDA